MGSGLQQDVLQAQVQLTALLQERLRRVAELEGYPDLDMGIGYRIRRRVTGDPVGGDDFLSAGVTSRLPLDRTRWRERIAERSVLL